MPSSPENESEPLFRVPWGLFVVLVVYAACVYGYVYTQYWNSPEYKGALLYAQAVGLLGVDDGRRCTESELNTAFELTMQAAVLVPEQTELVKHLENLRHRFDERKFPLKAEWVNRVEMMSVSALRIEQERKPWLIIGARERGWAPAQLLEGPQRVVLWSIPGGVFIIAFWAYTRLSGKAARARLHEARLKKEEEDVAALGHFRRGLSTSARPLPKIEDDADTLASSPPKRVEPPSRVEARASAAALKQVRSSRPAAKKPNNDDD